MSAAPSSVLIVDDEVDACQNLADILSDLGYRVDTACDGPRALEKLRKSRYDVALLDLMMPGMDGVSLYREIKDRRPETVAVLTTAFPGHPKAEEGLGIGIWRIVPKPVDLEHLLGVVDQAVNLPVVLIVDDDADLCANLWDLLRLEGYRVSVAHSLQSATELLSGNGFKVVLIDLRLPDGSGTDLFRTIQKANAQARTVLISAHWEELHASLGKSGVVAADAVCQKPFDMQTLLAIIERLCRA